MQMFHANRKQHASDKYKQGDHVYLSMQNLALPRGRAGKSVPRFIGPYIVKEANNAASTVTLELLPELTSRHISPTFHASLIRWHIANNNNLFPHREANSFYDFSTEEEQEWLIDEIIAHRWSDAKDLELQVKWTLGDVTWEPLASCKELEALDSYLELRGVT